jgi:hypothetical protein
VLDTMTFENIQPAGGAGSAKLPIPRLEKHQLPPPKKTQTKKPRVSSACVSCRTRKVRCDGAMPRCQNCSDNIQYCVYPSSRKNRLKTATEQNQDMVSLLRSLHSIVPDSEKQRIEDTLNGVCRSPEALSCASSADLCRWRGTLPMLQPGSTGLQKI